MEKLQNRITLNPQVLQGKPTIRGLRISVEQILQGLANGLSPDELMQEYPELEPEDFLAVYEYASELVSEQRIYPLTG